MTYQPRTTAALALADGTVFGGTPFGAPVDGAGEAVFTTTMTGYQEVCTDPSFRGQLVCMTYPLIGNYGVNDHDDQSRRPWIDGLIVREAASHPSHYQSSGTIDDYLRRWGIPGIAGIDTRALTRHLRMAGDMRAVIVHDRAARSDDELVALARAAPLPGEQAVVDQVKVTAVERYGPNDGPHIVVLDCGVKRNIVRALLERGARVTVIPYGSAPADIVALAPDGVIVSPGPGDPANLDDGLDIVKSLLVNDTPYFGICLGHQLLARAIGAETTKLKFGHRGGNHPVRNELTGRVSITAQNHGFRVETDSIPTGDGWSVAITNLNDGSVEGLTHVTRPVLSVQFHPEAAPGPLDNGALFDQFLATVRGRMAGAPEAHA